MQQRQPRLGDILDDYCPRERRVTNHVVVAMIGEDVKQTRCTTCDADHDYKHAKVPRQRRKDTPTALSAQVLAGGPKRVVHEAAQGEAEAFDEVASNGTGAAPDSAGPSEPLAAADLAPAPAPEKDAGSDAADLEERENVEEGPAHRRLIRATLPRIEGQPPPTRPGPDFTIRQPNNRQGRFRSARGVSPFHNSNRSGNAGGGDGMPRHGGGRPPMMSRQGPRHGPPQGGRKRSK
ncbi:MAG: hypothetical protein ABJA98_27385 [Acidobacteriota bacterium]